MSVLAEIASEIKISEESLREQVDVAQEQIKIYRVRKRSGRGQRKIAVPPRVLKMVQYWTIKNILRQIPLSEAATAFKPGSSIRHNAEMHRDGEYFVRLDISDFFPSISSADFFNAINEEDSPETLLLSESMADPHFVRCFFLSDRCAIGYPVSPYIANIVMAAIDAAIIEKLGERADDFGHSVYTRYADDMTISVQNRGFKRQVRDIVGGVLRDTDSPNLVLNVAKTKYGSKKGGGAFVTGLRICPDGRIVLHRKYKDHVRLMLSLESKGILNANDRPSLVGHLNYCSFADPGFFTRLATKHVDAIRVLLGPNEDR